MDGADEGLLALDRPLRTAAPVWWPRPAVYALLAYFGVLLTIGGVLDDIRREFPVIAMTGGFVGLAGSLDLKPFEMDGRGSGAAIGVKRHAPRPSLRPAMSADPARAQGRT